MTDIPLFRDFYPISRFMEYLDIDPPLSDHDLYSFIEERFILSLKEFLRVRKHNGLIKPVKNSDGFSTYFINRWNELATYTNQSNLDLDDILEKTASSFSFSLYASVFFRFAKMHNAKTLSPKEDIHLYSSIVDNMTKGNFHSNWTLSEECTETGEQVHVFFTDWDCTVAMINGRSVSSYVRPEKATIKEVSINFQSGDLLISDWFRITEFTQTVSYDKANIRSINSRIGRERATKHYADEFGVLSVCVGNTCPGIYLSDNSIAVGQSTDEYGEDDELQIQSKTPIVGKVCTDLWWTTIVDRERLVEIISASRPREEADKIVDDYIKEHEGLYGVTRLSVEPGTYYLYYGGHYEDFNEKFKATYDTSELNFNGIEELYFVVSKNRLTPLTV